MLRNGTHELLLMGSSESSVSRIVDEYRTNDACFIETSGESEPIAVIAYRIARGRLEVLDIAVEPTHRRRGVGSSLIEEAILRHSPQSVVAETDDDAVEFYRKLGFKALPFESKWGTTRYTMNLDVRDR